MAESIEFSKKVIEAADAKIEWYNSNVIPKITDSFTPA